MHDALVLDLCRTYDLVMYRVFEGLHFARYGEMIHFVPWKYFKRDGKGVLHVYSAQASELVMAVKLHQAFS